MAQHSVSFEVSGTTYEYRYLSPLDALDMARDLTEALSPVLGALGGAVMSDKDMLSNLGDVEALQTLTGNTEAWASAPERALNGFFKHFTKQMQRDLIAAMSKQTTVHLGDRAPQLSSVFDVHFLGRTLDVYKWLFECLRIEFKDLFEGIAPLIGQLGQ